MSKIPLVAIAALCLVVFQPLAAEKHGGPGPTENESKLWLVGDSSLHVYSSTAHNLKVTVRFPSDKPAFEQLKAGQLKTLEVTVPVKEMRSGKDGLDKNMQKALKAEENPNIFFRMEKYEIAASTNPSREIPVKAAGILEIAGVKNEVVLNGTLNREGAGARIKGTKEVLMTDYGIKPPKILLIKTYNEIQVHYDLVMDEKGNLK